MQFPFFFEGSTDGSDCHLFVSDLRTFSQITQLNVNTLHNTGHLLSEGPTKSQEVNQRVGRGTFFPQINDFIMVACIEGG